MTTYKGEGSAFRLSYTKGLEVKFISHLDLMRAFERAIRRANLPAAYSQGFNPRMKIKWGQALKVGQTSESEFMEIVFESAIFPQEVKDRLNNVLPAGIRILTAEGI